MTNDEFQIWSQVYVRTMASAVQVLGKTEINDRDRQLLDVLADVAAQKAVEAWRDTNKGALKDTQEVWWETYARSLPRALHVVVTAESQEEGEKGKGGGKNAKRELTLADLGDLVAKADELARSAAHTASQAWRVKKSMVRRGR